MTGNKSKLYAFALAGRDQLRRRGLEVTKYPYTVPARRQRLLSYLDVDLVVDVGANVGQYARHLRRNGYARKILSLEPAPAAFSALAAASADDPEWEVRQVGVGAATGVLPLHISENDVFSSFLPLSPNAEATDPASRYVATEQVDLQPLDDIVEGRGDRLAVKMDVQGFEREVIKGGDKSLSRAVFAEVETSVVDLYDGGMLWPETMERMESFGLSLATVENLMTEESTGRALAFNGLFVRASQMPV